MQTYQAANNAALAFDAINESDRLIDSGDVRAAYLGLSVPDWYWVSSVESMVEVTRNADGYLFH